MTNRMRGVVVFLVVALTATEGRAAGRYDPAMTWRTFFTQRFAVHYHEGAQRLAVRVGRMGEEVLDEVGELLGFFPDGRIDIVLSDISDRANGSAQVMPKNIVRVYLTAPTELTGLSEYDDWLRILLIHELAHICDLDQTWGLTRVGRWLLGKYVAMNSYTPQFLSEGVAVFAETVLSRTGRGRSSYVAMLLRMAALEDEFLEIDQGHVQFSDWPGPNAAYFYGGIFHLWLADKFGRQAVRDLHQFYAAQPIPYVYWFGAKKIFGTSLPSLWDQWREEEKQFAIEVRESVVARGETKSHRLTFHGRNVTGARYSPGGDLIIYSRTSPVDGSTVRTVDRNGDNDRHLVLETFSPRFSFSPDGQSFFFSQNAINERFNDFNDLYRYDLDQEEARKLVDKDAPDRSLRARDPAISPDGQSIVFVQNSLHQNWLTVGEVDGPKGEELTLRVLVPPQGDTQHASPVFSPDGRMVAVSTWFPEQPHAKRDIVLLDTQTGSILRRITSDPALDGNPAWSPDGRFLLYESDWDGISNIYAYDLQEDRYYRITRVVGGAFQAHVAPDGRHILFRNASGVGFDIHEMPFDPHGWEPQHYEPSLGYTEVAQESTQEKAQPRPWATHAWQQELSREAEPIPPLRAEERDEPYSPWRSLLPFNDNHVLMPSLYLRGDDLTGELATFGQDTLGQHAYMLHAGSSMRTRHFNWGFSYANDQWYPTFVLSYADLALSYALQQGYAKELQRSARADVALPIKLRHLAILSYVYERRTALNDAAKGTLSLGRFAHLELGYRYRFVRQFPYSVGAEHGSTVAAALRWYPRPLGADFNEVMLNIDMRGYLNNPLFDNHVLGLRVAAAVALGPDFKEKLALGGATGSSIFSVQTEQVYPLRGFPVDLERYPPGIGLAALYAEYRFPIWHVERGLWTLPVYLERLHAAVFADGGNTLGDGREKGFRQVVGTMWKGLRRSRLGVGAEVRTTVSIGWQFPLTMRLGVGWPVIVGGRPFVNDVLRQAHLFFAFGAAV